METMARQRRLSLLASPYIQLFPASTKPCALLDRFEQEHNQGKVRKQLSNKQGMHVARLLGAFIPFLEAYYGDWEKDYYILTLKAIRGIEFTAKDIQALIPIMAEYNSEPGFDHAAGYFLSALANSAREKSILLDIRVLETKLVSLGRFCTKELTITGNAGDSFGFGMRRGKLTLNGNCGEYTGLFMNNGELVVNGDSGDVTGYGMKKGILTVNGNCFGRVGGEAQFMGDDLVIRINGNIRSIYSVTSGNIFQYDRQIVKDGNEIAKIENK